MAVGDSLLDNIHLSPPLLAETKHQVCCCLLRPFPTQLNKSIDTFLMLSKGQCCSDYGTSNKRRMGVRREHRLCSACSHGNSFTRKHYAKNVWSPSSSSMSTKLDVAAQYPSIFASFDGSPRIIHLADVDMETLDRPSRLAAVVATVRFLANMVSGRTCPQQV